MRITVLGGGPAGLSAARLLQEAGHAVTLLEKNERLGGKCLSYTGAGGVIEFGTCYATEAHKLFERWAIQGGFQKRSVGSQYANHRPVMEYIVSGDKVSFSMQLLRYFSRRRKVLAGIKRGEQWAFDEAALPLGDWLKANRLPALERFFIRSIVSCGYGYIETVPTLHALRWNDWNMIKTGLKKSMWMPLEGWQAVWEDTATHIGDVQLNCEITQISRQARGGTVKTADGRVFEHDLLVNSIPMDAFNEIVDQPSDNEQKVEAAVEWSSYSCALISADWFSGYSIWINTNHTLDRHGTVGGARAEPQQLEGWKGALYIVGQNAQGFESHELDQMAAEDVRRDGGHYYGTVERKHWTYFPQMRSEAIRDGILKDMDVMQGENATFHTGAIFSHESVSHIMSFNENVLVPRITAYAKPVRDESHARDVQSIELTA